MHMCIINIYILVGKRMVNSAMEKSSKIKKEAKKKLKEWVYLKGYNLKWVVLKWVV